MIIVSACLAGVECRYNGQASPVSQIVEMVRKGQAIPLCPELLGDLPTPRPSVEQCGEKFVSNSGKDFTTEFIAGAEVALAISKLVGCTMVILKSKSPTCGCGLIYDGTFSGNLIEGDGIFCKLLKQENIKVYTEVDLQEARGRFAVLSRPEKRNKERNPALLKSRMR